MMQPGAEPNTERTRPERARQSAHDVRSSLNAVIGYAEMILDAPSIDSTIRDYARTIERNGLHILAMLNSRDLVPEPVVPVPMPPVDVAPDPCSARFVGRVLLAEDSHDSQRIVNYLLKRCGLEVAVVDNGRSAVETVIDAASAGAGFDIVFLDLEMPVLGGAEAVGELRERGLTAVPLVALTAHAMPGDRERCLADGFDDYLSKPLERSTLVRVLSRFVLPVETGAGDRRPLSLPAERMASPSGDFASARSKNRLISRLAGEPHLAGVLRNFVVSLPQTVAKIQERLSARDIAGVRSIMHQLKGTGGAIGFDDITTHARAAEVAIRLGADELTVRAAVEQVMNVLRRVDGFPTASVAA